MADHPLGIPPDLPLAVLISGQTANSCEVVAIETVGRKNAVLISEPSACYTTANYGFPINTSTGLNMAIDYDADRIGKVYADIVQPNIEVIGGDDFEALTNNQKVKAALDWFRLKPKPFLKP